MSPDQQRAAALRLFAHVLDCPPVRCLRQRGRDVEQARFYLVLEDGREIKLGGITTLWTQTEVGKILALAISSPPLGVKADVWREAVRAVFQHALEVQEAEGESYTDAVREWAIAHTADARRDKDGAVPNEMPFLDDDGRVNLHVGSLISMMRGRYGEQPKRTEVIAALAEIGFERIAHSYDRKGGKRTSKSYYRFPLDELERAAR